MILSILFMSHLFSVVCKVIKILLTYTVFGGVTYSGKELGTISSSIACFPAENITVQYKTERFCCNHMYYYNKMLPFHLCQVPYTCGYKWFNSN